MMRTTEELLNALLDGELTGEEQAQIERQLAESAELRQVYEELRTIRLGFDALPQFKLGPGFADKIVKLAEAAKQKQDALVPAAVVAEVIAEVVPPDATIRPAMQPATGQPAVGQPTTGRSGWYRWVNIVGLATAALLVVSLYRPEVPNYPYETRIVLNSPRSSDGEERIKVAGNTMPAPVVVADEGKKNRAIPSEGISNDQLADFDHGNLRGLEMAKDAKDKAPAAPLRSTVAGRVASPDAGEFAMPAPAFTPAPVSGVANSPNGGYSNSPTAGPTGSSATTPLGSPVVRPGTTDLAGPPAAPPRPLERNSLDAAGGKDNRTDRPLGDLDGAANAIRPMTIDDVAKTKPGDDFSTGGFGRPNTKSLASEGARPGGVAAEDGRVEDGLVILHIDVTPEGVSHHAITELLGRRAIVQRGTEQTKSLADDTAAQVDRYAYGDQPDGPGKRDRQRANREKGTDFEAVEVLASDEAIAQMVKEVRDNRNWYASVRVDPPPASREKDRFESFQKLHPLNRVKAAELPQDPAAPALQENNFGAAPAITTAKPAMTTAKPALPAEGIQPIAPAGNGQPQPGGGGGFGGGRGAQKEDPAKETGKVDNKVGEKLSLGKGAVGDSSVKEVGEIRALKGAVRPVPNDPRDTPSTGQADSKQPEEPPRPNSPQPVAPQPDRSKPESNPGESKQADAKLVDPKKAEPTPTERKSKEPLTAESKPGDSKGIAARPADPKQADSIGIEAKTEGSKAGEATPLNKVEAKADGKEHFSEEESGQGQVRKPMVATTPQRRVLLVIRTLPGPTAPATPAATKSAVQPTKGSPAGETPR